MRISHERIGVWDSGMASDRRRNRSIKEITGKVRVHEGRSHIPTEVGAKLAERMNKPELSARELGVIKLMAKGNNNREIGEKLSITEGTVKFHVNNILSKLQVNDRTQAVITALKRGITNL